MGGGLAPPAKADPGVISICFHGAESTGKSTLVAKLATELGALAVAEYGRTYCERHGTDLTMADLLAIAAGQAAETERAAATHPPLLLLDTDQLMTGAWAKMLFGQIPDVLFSYPRADLYLLFAADVPWRDDGTRMFGSAEPRSRFAVLSEAVLIQAGVTYRVIGGHWQEREAQVRTAIRDAMTAAGVMD